MRWQSNGTIPVRQVSAAGGSMHKQRCHGLAATSPLDAAMKAPSFTTAVNGHLAPQLSTHGPQPSTQRTTAVNAPPQLSTEISHPSRQQSASRNAARNRLVTGSLRNASMDARHRTVANAPANNVAMQAPPPHSAREQK